MTRCLPPSHELSMNCRNSVQPPAPGRRPILIDDACRLLGKAKQTVYALACRGEIPNYKQGRTVYFFEDELLEWIASGKVKTNEELRKEAERALYKGTRR